MNKLTIDELHQLRLCIFENAESLHSEALLLLENGFCARAYLLAYFACEELGKIPIVVGAIGCHLNSEVVDWKKIMKRFRDHKAKVESDDFHQYVFGIDLDPLCDSDLKWLEEAKSTSVARVETKNNSTYVDVHGRRIVSPLKVITKEHAEEMVERAFSSLRAHSQTECLTNPIIKTANSSINTDAAR